METNLIDFDYIPATSVINNSSPSYYDLESQIGEQNKKIESLEKTVGKMQDLIDELSKPQDPDISLLEMRSILYGMNEDMNILKTMHNNFCIQINYIDYKPEYVADMKQMNDRDGNIVYHSVQIAYYKKQIKTKLIPFTCEVLDISDIILDNHTSHRLSKLCNLKHLITNEIQYCINPSKFVHLTKEQEARRLKESEVCLVLLRYPSFEKNGDIAGHIYNKDLDYFRPPPKITIV
jgi:hypothetical protein